MNNFKFEILTDKTFVIGQIYCKYYISDTNKPLVITFASGLSSFSEEKIEKSMSPWGFEFVKNQNLNVISFDCAYENSWYRDEEFYVFTKELSKKISIFPKRFGYGGSRGGYGVSAYSNVLKIDKILIINPISTLNENLVPFERRFRIYKKLDWIGPCSDGADTKSSGYIIYDPIHTLDKKHADRYTTLVHLKVPGVGHSMPEHLQKMGMLKWIFMDFVHENLDINKFYAEARKRRNLPRYYEWMLSKANSHLTTKRKEVILSYKNKHFPSGREKKEEQTAISIENNHINLFRDAAIALEKIDIKQAYELMYLAHQFRPKGPTIKKKLSEYKKKLK